MFSEKLKQTRKIKNLKQKDVAESLCLERSTYAGYETNKNKPSFEKLVELADFFNVSIDYLLDRTENPILLNIPYQIEDDIDLHELKIAEDLAVFRKYMTMENEDKKAVIEFIEARILLHKSNNNKK